VTGENTISRGEQTRTSILQAAYDLFLTTGYHGTSMRQIANRAGIALGGIYNHFSSKEEIFTAVIVAYHPINELLPALDQASGGSAESLLRNAAQRIGDRISGRPEFLNLFFSEMVEFKGRHIPLLLSAFMPRIMVFSERLTPHMPELRAIPVPILVRVFISMVLAYILTELFINPIFPNEYRKDSKTHFIDIFLHGVLRKEDEHG
jgi:AcrR family transcriptional regulator